MTFTSLRHPKAIGVLTTVSLISGIGFFTSSGIGIAVDAIQKDLDFSITQIQWFINSYSFTLAVFMLLAGSLGDRINRKKLMIGGLLTYIATSVGISLLSDMWMLASLRCIQGIGAALTIPQSLAIIRTQFSKDIRPKAIGIWSAAAGLMAVAGPFFGGLIIDLLSWRALFWVPIPLAAIALMGVGLCVAPRKTTLTWRAFDLNGAFILLLSLGALSFALIDIGEHTVTLVNASFMIASALLMALFVWYERKHPHPIVSFHLLKRRHILGVNVFTFVVYGGLAAVMFLLIINFTQLQGWSGTRTAVAMMPVSVLIAALSVWSGRLTNRFRASSILLLGGLLVSAGVGWATRMSVDINYWYDTLPGMILVAIGFGLFVPTLSALALDVPAKESGLASGFNNSISRFAGQIVLILFTSLLLILFTRDVPHELGIATADRAQHDVVRHETPQNGALMGLTDAQKQYIQAHIVDMLAIDLSSKDAPFDAASSKVARQGIHASFADVFRIEMAILAGFLALGTIVSWAIIRSGEHPDSP